MVETPKVTEGTVLWKPSEQAVARCRMGRYLEWLRAERGLAFDDYATLWDWSVADVGAFWQSIWDRFEMRSPTTRPRPPWAGGRCPGPSGSPAPPSTTRARPAPP